MNKKEYISETKEIDKLLKKIAEDNLNKKSKKEIIKDIKIKKNKTSNYDEFSFDIYSDIDFYFKYDNPNYLNVDRELFVGEKRMCEIFWPLLQLMKYGASIGGQIVNYKEPLSKD